MRTWIQEHRLMAGIGIAVLVPALALAVGVFVLWLRSPGPDPAVLVDGETRTSPSGNYTVEFYDEDIDGKRNLYPAIKDSDGEVVWSDDERYQMSAHPVRVLWQDDDDVLWLMSRDIGNARVMLTDGQWAKDRTWTTYPANVQKIEEEQR
ncbi:hypothetical protein [Actinobaculum sp. 352]|uniref:hypothetical protein n=1 Tax=Actinobaculum sp. 352 TaxID=2490946 RepID=UPI000F7D6C14|nr:hypothetical protein [Actinobaculum sp. 352]RTE50617.1 hypothetical protein EKN07_00185 [Actinobaculum sp. 352]